MKVLQLNIRASQGGAGRVALDLHRRLRKAGITSKLLYGYGSGIKDDPVVAGEEGIERIGTVSTVLFNYFCHRIFGWDPVTGNTEMLRTAIASSDVVHLHAVHHHFLNWSQLIELLVFYRRPTVITAHDWWFLTGRCGFTEGCESWKKGCGECGSLRFRDPESLLDCSRYYRKLKVESIYKLGQQVQFICPATHLADDYKAAFPRNIVKIIPNSTDLEFDEALSKAEEKDGSREGIVFSAADLSSELKIDRTLVSHLAAETRVKLIMVGRNNPFTKGNLENCGEIRDRLEMANILRRAEALAFCSRTDICPLTVLEALAAGCYVLAYSSAAAIELLSQVGGRCVPDGMAMLDVIKKKEISGLYGGISPKELAKRAKAVFSGDNTMQGYIATYHEALKGTGLADSTRKMPWET